MKRDRRIDIVAIQPGAVAPEVLKAVVDRLSREQGLRARLGAPVELRADEVDPGGTVEPDRVLDAILARAPPAAAAEGWTLAITGLDLLPPDRTAAFGEAMVGGWLAIVGIARFGATGSPSPRLLERTCKAALHELGHLAGLGHCPSPGCAMSSARTVADIDRKNSEFCDSCSSRFRNGLRP